MSARVLVGGQRPRIYRRRALARKAKGMSSPAPHVAAAAGSYERYACMEGPGRVRGGSEKGPRRVIRRAVRLEVERARL